MGTRVGRLMGGAETRATHPDCGSIRHCNNFCIIKYTTQNETTRRALWSRSPLKPCTGTSKARGCRDTAPRSAHVASSEWIIPRSARFFRGRAFPCPAKKFPALIGRIPGPCDKIPCSIWTGNLYEHIEIIALFGTGGVKTIGDYEKSPCQQGNRLRRVVWK